MTSTTDPFALPCNVHGCPRWSTSTCVLVASTPSSTSGANCPNPMQCSEPVPGQKTRAKVPPESHTPIKRPPRLLCVWSIRQRQACRPRIGNALPNVHELPPSCLRILRPCKSMVSSVNTSGSHFRLTSLLGGAVSLASAFSRFAFLSASTFASFAATRALCPVSCFGCCFAGRAVGGFLARRSIQGWTAGPLSREERFRLFRGVICDLSSLLRASQPRRRRAVAPVGRCRAPSRAGVRSLSGRSSSSSVVHGAAQLAWSHGGAGEQEPAAHQGAASAIARPSCTSSKATKALDAGAAIG